MTELCVELCDCGAQEASPRDTAVLSHLGVSLILHIPGMVSVVCQLHLHVKLEHTICGHLGKEQWYLSLRQKTSPQRHLFKSPLGREPGTLKCGTLDVRA